MLVKEKYKICHNVSLFSSLFLSSLVKRFEPHTCIVVEGFGALQKCIYYYHYYRASQLDCPKELKEESTSVAYIFLE